MRKLLPLPENIPEDRLPAVPCKRVKKDSWGNNDTVGFRLKKIGSTVYSPIESFGIFLGQEISTSRYCVGVFNEDNSVQFVYSYDSIEELKHSWELD